jgi:hypothetical protein
LSQAPTAESSPLRAALALLSLAAWAAAVAAMRPPVTGRATALWLAPFGFLAVFAFADRSFWAVRALLVALPAFGLGLAAVFALLWWRIREAGPPGPSELLLPAFAVALGVAFGLAWRRSLFAVLVLPLKLAVLALALGLLAGVGLVFLADRQPLVPAEGERSGDASGPADCRLAAPCASSSPPPAAGPPLRPPADERPLRLAPSQLDRLLACALQPLASPAVARAAVSAADEGRLRLRVSLRGPLLSRWLNADGSARVLVRRGRLVLGAPRLRLGQLAASPALLEALAPLAALALQVERPLRRALAPIHEAHVEAGLLVVSCGAPAVP